MRARSAATVLVVLGAAGLFLAPEVLRSQSAPSAPPPAFSDAFASRESRAIQYTARDPTDAVARLNQRLANRQARLNFTPGSGYLLSVLSALDIPVASQVAVFSRTSLQADIIRPKNPRVIFFNDSIAVAWPRGGFIELAAVDPEQGTIFYKLSQTQTSSPAIVRSDASCLNCHASTATLGVPGLAMASVVPDSDGLVTEAPTFVMDHRTPIAERWGGWYVTARRMPMAHLGNLVAPDPDHPKLTPTPDSIQLPSLATKFDTRDYPAASSDVVALMVLNHQTHMINLLTRLGWEVRLAAAGGAAAASGSSAPSGPSATSGVSRPEMPHLAEWAREVVDYMLFIDEAPLYGPIEGTSEFAATFAGRGPRDRMGRSLRDLDLGSRLFRYPCSYLIYSDQFDHLPAVARDAVYQRLRDVLTGQEKGPRYARLSAEDRRAILEILRETKKEAAAAFGP